jgi:bifunctional DNA-binding transcriptional regulator/antitoxin component of YhaV-PrlF toxin-antitoxin module
VPANAMERDVMNRKIISVSKKRQITIPLQFYKHLNLDNEVECSLEDGKIIIKPLHREAAEFSVEILKDLISQGYSGEENETYEIGKGGRCSPSLFTISFRVIIFTSLVFLVIYTLL